MHSHDNHINDQDLLLEADGEGSSTRAAEIRQHLSRCWSCRTRKAELEQAIVDFVQVQHKEFEGHVPPIEGPRALLRARLAEAARQPRRRAAAAQPQAWQWPQHGLAWAGVLAVLVALGCVLTWSVTPHVGRSEFAPNAAWTPGSVRPLSKDAVCSTPERAELRPAIATSVAQEVFTRYGIRDPRPRFYEVDYLIPPALGGSDDPRNLWPEPYATGVWNARVKDALEDRLRSLVCGGTLDLATAQHDLARDWIAAYKKYFRTDRPLLEHAAFVKDRAWE